MKLRTLALIAVALLLSACATEPVGKGQDQVEISKVLEEINSALNKSIPNDPDFPALTSITLDLQVSVDATLGANVPFNVVSVGSTLNKSRLHRVVVDFVPNIARQTSSVEPSKEESQLTAAISALYQSVAHASPAYRLQHTSISLQCTFKAQGSAGLKLVPVQSTTSASRQTTQTLTINFGRDPNRFMSSNADGSGSGGGGAGGSRKNGTDSGGADAAEALPSFPATTPSTTPTTAPTSAPTGRRNGAK